MADGLTRYWLCKTLQNREFDFQIEFNIFIRISTGFFYVISGSQVFWYITGTYR